MDEQGDMAIGELGVTERDDGHEKSLREQRAGRHGCSSKDRYCSDTAAAVDVMIRMTLWDRITAIGTQLGKQNVWAIIWPL